MIRELVGSSHPALLPVHALENQGYNRIPVAYAQLLAERLGLEVDNRVVQANVVNHTGATGWERMVRAPLFDGSVAPGQDYLMVDDFVGQGGTLANLRGYLIRGGGKVLGATTLTGRTDSATLALREDTRFLLREKHGEQLEEWWRENFGYGFDCLTESEARYLLRVEDADTIRARVIAAGSEEQH